MAWPGLAWPGLAVATAATAATAAATSSAIASPPPFLRRLPSVIAIAKAVPLLAAELAALGAALPAAPLAASRGGEQREATLADAVTTVSTPLPALAVAAGRLRRSSSAAIAPASPPAIGLDVAPAAKWDEGGPAAAAADTADALVVFPLPGWFPPHPRKRWARGSLAGVFRACMGVVADAAASKGEAAAGAGKPGGCVK